MAKFLKGILGGFSGLVGTVVGSTWRTLDVMKSRPKKSNKAPVQSQTDQRLKFGLVTEFLGGISSLIELGYQSNNKVITPMNAAVKYHLQNAITGVSPKFSLDYSKVVISNGSLHGPDNLQVVPVTGSKLTVSWDPLVGYSDAEIAIRNSDEGMLVIYSPAKDRYVTYLNTLSREAGSLSVKVPNNYVGTPLHVFFFFAAVDGKSTSDSEYFGPVTAIV